MANCCVVIFFLIMHSFAVCNNVISLCRFHPVAIFFYCLKNCCKGPVREAYLWCSYWIWSFEIVIRSLFCVPPGHLLTASTLFIYYYRKWYVWCSSTFRLRVPTSLAGCSCFAWRWRSPQRSTRLIYSTLSNKTSWTKVKAAVQWNKNQNRWYIYAFAANQRQHIR